MAEKFAPDAVAPWGTSNKINFFLCSLQIKTVKVSNISLAASARDITEFFSFSGDIQYVEMQRSVHLNYVHTRSSRYPHSLKNWLCFWQGN